MVEDFRISTSFRNNKKRIRLQRCLGAEGVLAVIDLWGYAAENKPDGILSNMDEEDICIAANWGGDTAAFIDAIADKKSRFIERDEESGWYVIHDWMDHNPYVSSFEKRSQAGKKAINARWEREKKKNQNTDSYESNTDRMNPYYESNETVIPDASIRNTPTNHTNHTNQPNQPVEAGVEPSASDDPPPGGPPAEKPDSPISPETWQEVDRREVEPPQAVVQSEPPPIEGGAGSEDDGGCETPPRLAIVPDDPAFLVYPCLPGKKGSTLKEFRLSEATVRRWESLPEFAEMDVRAVLRKAWEHVKKPSNRKTAPNMEAWLYKTWLCRDLESGRYPKRKPTAQSPPAPGNEKDPVETGGWIPLSGLPDVRAKLRAAIGEEEFRDWFDVEEKQSDCICFESDFVTLGINSKYRLEYLAKRHDRAISEAFGGKPVDYQVLWAVKAKTG